MITLRGWLPIAALMSAALACSQPTPTPTHQATALPPIAPQTQAQPATNTSRLPTNTAAPTNTSIPTDTHTPIPTDTPAPTDTPLPTATETPRPTATRTLQPAPTRTPGPTRTVAPPTNTLAPASTNTEAPPALPDVRITFVLADGAVPSVESDEYAVITNLGNAAINLSGWRLNAGDNGQNFYFPAYDLQPGQNCSVYTNEFHPESCGFSFGSGRALWNNGGDCGYLYDANGNQVSSYCY